MADERKKPHKPDDPKSKDKATHPALPDLELPPDPEATEEVIEVVEIVEDDIPVVEAATPDEDVEEIAEVVEIVEDDDAIDEVLPVVASDSGSGIAAVELVENEVDLSSADEPLDEVEVLPSSSSVIAAPLVEDDDVDEVEVMPSSSSVIAAPLVEDDAIDEVEVVPSSSGLIAAALVESDLDVADAVDKATKEVTRDSVESPFAKISEEAQEIEDINKTISSGITIEDEAVVETESGFALNKEAKALGDADIDLDEILKDSVESSAVDLGGPVEESLLPASAIPETRQPSSARAEGQEGHAKLVSADDGDDAIDIISEDVLLDSHEHELVTGDDDDAVLVSPKKAAAAAHDHDMDAVEEISAADEEVEPPPPPRRMKVREEEGELVGAGSGGKRGGFMPFLLGGMLAAVTLGGGAAAAWYFNALPESPNAEKKPGSKTGTAIAGGKSADEFEQIKKEKDQAVAQFGALKKVLAQAKVPDEPDKLKAYVDSLSADKTAAETSLAQINGALAKAGINANDPKALAKLVAADAAAAAKERDELTKKLVAANSERNAAVEKSNTLEKENQKLAQSAEETAKERAAVTKERDELKTAMDTAKKELEKARAAGESPLGSSLGGILGAFTGMTKTPAAALGKLLDTTKLSAELAAAKAQNAFAESPEKRLDTMLILLNMRAISDPKELESYKRYIDWVRSKDAKTSPEAKAKALFAEALLHRNQDNYAGARQALDQAVKEAKGLKDSTALQKATSQSLKEMSDPAAYYLPRIERKVADGNFKGAADELSAALKALPDNPHLAAEAAYLTGRVQEQAGEWTKAEQSYRQALKLAGDSPAAQRYRIALAQVLLRSPGSSNEDEIDDEEAEFTDEEIAFVEQTGGDGDDRKKLEESVKIARDLIAGSSDPKTQGEGYMLLGVAEARLGKHTEGLKNFVKGLKLVNPGWSTAELDRIISNHPAFQQPDIAMQPNPQMSERHYSRGLDFFWAKKYSDAEAEFVKAVSFYGEDARYFYFLAMSRRLQGTNAKAKLAEADFERAVMLEMARPTRSGEISASLERVQGDLRKLVNSYRERAQR